MLRRPTLIALTIALVVPLAACVESTRIPDAAPSSDEAPLFASDEEALAAATAAYEEFLEVSGEILRGGGAEPERLRPLVSDEVYESEAEGYETLVANGLRATGQSVLIGTTLQQHVPGPAGSVEVVTYNCIDVEGTDVLNRDGVSQVDPNRPLILGFEIVFAADENGQLLVDRKTLWDTESACNV